MLMFTKLQYKTHKVIDRPLITLLAFCFSYRWPIKCVQKCLVIVALHGFPMNKHSNCFRILSHPRCKEMWYIQICKTGTFEIILLLPWHWNKLKSGDLSVLKLWSQTQSYCRGDYCFVLSGDTFKVSHYHISSWKRLLVAFTSLDTTLRRYPFS